MNSMVASITYGVQRGAASAQVSVWIRGFGIVLRVNIAWRNLISKCYRSHLIVCRMEHMDQRVTACNQWTLKDI